MNKVARILKNPAQALGKTLKRRVAAVPLFRRLMKKIESAEQENGALSKALRSLESELGAVRAESRVAVTELERLKQIVGSGSTWAPPGHFYSPIPAIQELKIDKDEIFDIPPAIRGVDLNEKRQLELLSAFSRFYGEQPFPREKAPNKRFFFENPNYSYADAITLYCMIRHLRPQRIIEVGSGYSSCAILDVNEFFFDNSIACTFIDPYPQLLRDLIKDTDSMHIRLLGQKVQDVDVSIFRELTSSDILFIDSSHVTKTGSDLNYLIFKILPLLREGVSIHFHDVFYPFEYPQEWVFEGRAWNEAYLLRAFLQYNREFEIQFFTTYLIHKHREVFESELPLCLHNTGASLWLRKIAQDPELDRVHERRDRKIKSGPRDIDLSRPEHGWFLRGEGWYIPEAGNCWMAAEASVQISGPRVNGERLTIRGFNPHREARLTVSIDGTPLGSIELPAVGPVVAEFLMPADLIGCIGVTAHIAIDRTYTVPGDPRKLGFSVTQIQVH